MKIVIVAIIMVTLTVPSLTTNIKAFCLWNCEGQIIKEVSPLLLDCLRFQYETGQYGKMTKYGEVTEDNKIKSRAELGKMITEDELKQEWKDYPELYEGDCHMMYDLTPQMLERNWLPE